MFYIASDERTSVRFCYKLC